MLGYRRVSLAVAFSAAILSLSAYAPALAGRAFLHDDAWIVGGNPLLDAGAAGAGALATTGYWEAAQGRAARVHEYRPLLMLSFLAQRMITGRSVPPMRAVNVLLHVLVCVLLFYVLRRRLSEPAAAAGTLLFAVMPTHVEAVAALTGRSELLAAALLLGSWLAFERRLAAGAGLFFAALFIKEHALLFPAFLALSDWTFDGAYPWSKKRRRVYAALLAATGAYLLLRLGVLGIPFGGGEPYFADRLTAARDVSRFALDRYLRPALGGGGLCPDFVRPLFHDSPPGDLASWGPLLALAGLYAAAIYALTKRRPWAFWVLGPSLFLLPTAHVLVPLDTIGAQRFFYLPAIGLAAGLGALWARGYERRPKPALGALALFLAAQAATCAAYAFTWSGGLRYYETVLACNPVSARANAAYGMELIAAGRTSDGEYRLGEAIRLSPALALPYYNLARLAWERGDVAATEARIKESLARDTASPDAWTLAALAAEKRGRSAEAELDLKRALALAPWSPAANFNLARLELAAGRGPQSSAHWRAYARWAPNDPDAPRAAELARSLESRR